MSKFKVGDKVRCINNPNGRPGAGVGYKEGLEFTVDRVAEYSMGSGRDCYFGGVGGAGVYEDYLELAAKFKEGDIITDGDAKYKILVASKYGYITSENDDFDSIDEDILTIDAEGYFEVVNEPEITELTLAEIAEKLNLPVESIRIKE